MIHAICRKMAYLPLNHDHSKRAVATSSSAALALNLSYLYLNNATVQDKSRVHYCFQVCTIIFTAHDVTDGYL